MDDMWGNDGPQIEFLILAEHVEVIHGKLYLMGGWETMHVAGFDAPVTLSPTDPFPEMLEQQSTAGCPQQQFPTG
jgi:hypothetical protein